MPGVEPSPVAPNAMRTPSVVVQKRICGSMRARRLVTPAPALCIRGGIA